MIFYMEEFQLEKKTFLTKKATSRKRYTFKETTWILIFNDDCDVSGIE